MAVRDFQREKNTLFKSPKDVSGLNAWNEAILNAKF